MTKTPNGFTLDDALAFIRCATPEERKRLAEVVHSYRSTVAGAGGPGPRCDFGYGLSSGCYLLSHPQCDCDRRAHLSYVRSAQAEVEPSYADDDH